MKVVEVFDGFVECFDGDTAYVRLISPQEERLYGKYPVKKLLELGIKERRRFLARTIEQDDGTVTVELEMVPDIVLTQEDIQRIRDRVDAIFKIDPFEGDY